MRRSQEEIAEFEKLNQEFLDLKELAEITEKEEDIGSEIEKFEKKLEQNELKVFLSAKYDRGNAILSIFSGAGGQDAQDWATLLLRMYQRYAGNKGFQTKVLEQSYGEAGGPEGRIGTKSATLEIKGNYAYGFLKRENGVHRLVRISPFSPKSLRHTSFALVEVLPELSQSEESEIKIRPDDLKIEFYRSSGPGGQYVNRRESAVRITHLPTGIVVTCQSERVQGENRQKAMKILISKLYRLRETEKREELAKIKGKKIQVSWGSQIRNYVFQPYQLVKDLRTGVETSNINSVLDGKLDQFIEAEIKLNK